VGSPGIKHLPLNGMCISFDPDCLMSCRDALDHFDDYLDGNLGRWARWRVRGHLWICRNCRRYLASYRMTIRLVQKVCGEEPAAVVPASLVTSILSAQRERR
jgi:predicted anti-sigma-YlaC factor YlaD